MIFTEATLIAGFEFGKRLCDVLCSPEGQQMMREWRENGDKAEAFFQRIFQGMKK